MVTAGTAEDRSSRRGEHVNRLKVYIAGPITGVDDYIERFARKAAKIESLGLEAINPAEFGSSSDGDGEWHDLMRRALKAMLDADAVLMLANWHRSQGATEERRIAVLVGMPVFFTLTGVKAFAIERYGLDDDIRPEQIKTHIDSITRG